MRAGALAAYTQDYGNFEKSFAVAAAAAANRQYCSARGATRNQFKLG